MLLGALVAAGAPAEWLLGVPGSDSGCPASRIAIETVDRCGLRATKVNVNCRTAAEKRPSPLDSRTTAHAHPTTPTTTTTARIVTSAS